MALNRIPITPDAARDAKARQLVKTAHTWPTITLKQPYGAFKVGDSFLVTPNGYRVNHVVCECPDYATWGNVCKHIRCVVMLDEQAITKPAPRKTYDDLVPSCDVVACNDEREPGQRFCYDHLTADVF